MKNRNLVSISIAFGFVAISATGLCLYFGIKMEFIEIVHVLFGLLFTVLVVFHIWYNFASLKNYSKDRKTNAIKKELVIGVSVSTLLLVLMCSGSPFMEDLTHIGRSLAGNNKEHRRPGEGLIFSPILTNVKVRGTSLRVIIRKNEQVLAPVIAIWVTDTSNKHLENLFVPAKKLDLPASVTRLHDFENPDVKNLVQSTPFNAAMLPEFNKTGTDQSPNYNNATPINNFILETNTHARNDFIVYLEISYKNKTELYYATIHTGKSNVFSFASSANEFLKDAIVRIN